jgi:multidrug resistance protein
LKRQLAIIGITLFTIFVGFGIVIPVLPIMVEDSGAPYYHFHIMLAAYSAVSFLMSPFWGRLSDRIGRRPVLMVGVIGFAVSFFLFGISSDQLWLMYLSRLLGGLFSGATTACAVAYVADITTEENRTKGMGIVGMSIGLGFVFGPAIGGILSRFGNATPFYIASAVSLMSFVFVAVNLKESLSEEKRMSKVDNAASRWTGFTGSVKFMYMLLFIVTFTLAGLESTLQFFQMRTYGATAWDVGLMFFASGIVGALIQGGVVRRYVKNGDEPNVIRIGLVLSALGFILLIFSNSFVTATIYLCIFGAGNALLRPCITSLITQKTKVGQGAASGLSSSMDSLGRIAGPLIAAVLYKVNIGLPFIFGGILCLAALILVTRFTVADNGVRQAERAI